jgi:uncharacterized protein
MAEIMMRLGSFGFGLDTAAYQEFQRSTAYTWASLSRFGQDDALQSTGPGADTISLPGVVYPEHFGGTGQLDALRALGAKAQPQTLIDGRGNMLGQWVVEGVDERGTVFAQRGVARRQEFTVKLRRFQSDATGLASGLLSVVAGTLPVSSVVTSALNIATTAAKGPAGLLSSLGTSLSSITGLAGQIGGQASGILSAVNSGMSAARTLQNAGLDAGRLLGGVRSLANVPSAMNGLINAGGDVSRAAGAASSILKLAGIDMAASGVNPDAIKAVKNSMVQVNQVNVMAVNVRNTAQTILGRT